MSKLTKKSVNKLTNWLWRITSKEKIIQRLKKIKLQLNHKNLERKMIGKYYRRSRRMK